MGWFNSSFQSRSDNTGFTDFSVNLVSGSFVRDLNFIRAGEAAAEVISRNHSGDLYLGLSGGQSSEWVLRRFNSIVRGRVVPIVISLPWNDIEVQEARRICSELSIEPWVVEYSDRSWLYNRFEQSSYVQGRVGFMSGVQQLLVKEVDRVSGSLVTGSGHYFHMGLEPNVGYCMFTPQFYFYEWDYMFDSRHPGAFFTSSQQLFDSMLMNTDFSLDIYSSKCLLFRTRYRPHLELDLELFQQARVRWPWLRDRPRWRAQFMREQVQDVLTSAAG